MHGLFTVDKTPAPNFPYKKSYSTEGGKLNMEYIIVIFTVISYLQLPLSLRPFHTEKHTQKAMVSVMTEAYLFASPLVNCTGFKTCDSLTKLSNYNDHSGFDMVKSLSMHA